MTSIGVNLAGVTYWGTEAPFIDRFKTMGGWHATDASGKEITSSIQYDANGYPIGNAQVASETLIMQVDPHDSSPNNQYVLTYTGTASIKLNNATTISSAPGKVVFEVKAETGGRSSVLVTLKNLNASDPVTDMHVVRTDQVGLFNAGEIFNPAFVAKVAQWDVVRFMDWQVTNGFNDVSWATRTQLGDTSWASSQTTDGVPIEAMVQLANEAHVDMWYNVPTKADDAYVTQALTYIRDHLAKDLKVHVEYSNEMWNTGFEAFAYGRDKANAMWGVDANKDGKIDPKDAKEAVNRGEYVYYGYRSAQISDIAHKVFGSETDARVDNVLAGQSGGLQFMLPGVAKAGLGAVTYLFDDYAMAPYFGGQLSAPASGTADHDTILGWVRGGAAGMDAAFKEIEFGGGLSKDASIAWMHSLIAKAKLAADAAGLELVTYEGGPSLATTRWPSAEQAEVQAFFKKMLEDPRMGELYTKMLNDFAGQGGTTYVAYNDAQGGGTSGNWGILDDIYDDGSPRYDALLAARGLTHAAIATAVPGTIAAASKGGALNGLGSDDVIVAGPGNDTIDAGAGNDKIVGSSSTMVGKALVENDYYSGGAGSDTIVGGVGNDHIYGNQITTVAGTVDAGDNLSGGGGNDYINGNAGNDTIDGGAGNDRLYGGADNDIITGGSGADHIQGNKGLDTLSGGDGDDVINGGADQDRLNGNAGNDTLSGDAGNDRLSGGLGIDKLTGGAGADTFVFDLHEATFATDGKAAFQVDEITDFVHGTDKISLGFDVVQLFQGSATSAAAALTWATQQLAGHPGEDDVAAVTVGKDTYLFYDGTGSGGAIDSAIKVDNGLSTAFPVNASDFV